MRKNTNDEYLIQKRKIASENVLFYQTWKEKTDYLPIDSYQYRAMNTLSGIRELAEVIDKRLLRVYSTNHNVSECKSELLDIVKVDEVLKNIIRCVGTV